MPANWYRLNSNGTLVKLKGLYRLNSNGTLVKIKSAYRLNSNGTLVKVFAGLATPSVKVGNPPLLYLVDPSNFADPNIPAYNTYKMYLTRGRWNEDPLEFIMRIQRSTSSTFSSFTNLVNETKTYTTYSDSDFEDKVPLNTANRPTITNALIRAGNYYRGWIKATNSDGLFDEYATPTIKPRIDAQLSISLNLGGTIGSNPTTNGGTFYWTYTGYESIVAADVYSQTISFYPQGNTAVTPIYTESISPGTSTTAAPTTSVVISNAALQANTTYTVIVSAVMNDLWKTESSVLQTIASDSGDFTTAADKPATPVITSATDVGTNRAYNNGAVSLVWTQPNNGAAATGYKIEYSQGPGFITWVTHTANTGTTTTSGTFGGFLSNTAYKFRISAIGSGGTSDPSAESSSVTITTVPSAPTGVSALAGNGGADVSFTALSVSLNGGKSVIDYRSTSSPGSITTTNADSPIVVTGLTNYTSYTFTVAARNANGYSAESTASSPVTPQLPRPIGSGTVTIASQSASSYIYQITAYGTWSNSSTTYDYEWQTSSDSGATWITRTSGTNVATIPNYNASGHKTNSIRLLVYGRNQTGASLSPLTSNTLVIFYTTPIINSFSVTGSELLASWTYSYSTDDPSATVSLEYKLSSGSTWTSITLPSSPGQINLSTNTYDFRLTITNSSFGNNRSATSTVSNVAVTSLYNFAFGNILYPSTNGHIGLSGGSTTNIPATGKYLAIFPGDFVGNTSASPGYMLAWSDSTKYVIRFDGYRFGFVGQSAYRLEWMATFYTNQNYIDIKIITKGSSISGAVTAGLYNNGNLLASLPGPYTLNQGTTYRVNTDGTSGSFGVSYDEISITAPNDIMTTAGTLTGNSDDGFFTITTSANYYKSPVVANAGIISASTSLSLLFTESNGCDYVAYNVRTSSYSGTIISSGTILSSPISITGLNSSTTYYVTLTPYNYKNQAGTAIQYTALTAPPAPTVTFSNITTTGFTVSWSAIGATSYNVDIYNSSTFVSVGSNSTPTMPASGTTSTSATVTGLTSGAQYTITVAGVNAGGTGTNTVQSQTTNVTLSYLGNSNTGGSVPSSTTHAYGSSATVSGNTGSLTRTYATWAGWTLFSDGSGTVYGPGYTATIIMNGSQSLYARWLANTPGTPSVSVTYGPSTTTTSSNYLVFSPVNFGTDTSSVLLEWGTSTSYGNSSSVTTNGGAYTTPSNLSANTIYYWRARGYNPLLNGYGSAQTGSVTIPAAVSPPSGGTVTLTGNSTPGSVITASTSGWSGSPTSYDVYITTALSPNIPTSSSTRVASSGGSSSTSYTITSSDAVSPVNIFRAFATATNSGGTSGTVQSSNTITTTAAVSPPVNTGAPSVTPSSGAAGTTFSCTTGTWTNSPTGYSYNWQYNDQGTVWINTGQTSSTFNSTSWAGWTIRCQVTASNSGGSNTATSNSATVTSGGSAPLTPTGVGLTGSGVVSWTASSGATSYEIEFYTAQNGSGLNAAPTGATGYTVTGISASPYQLVSPYAAPNNYARVRVRARNSFGASTYSAWVPSATTYT
jgi:Fibronectin type III domain